MKLPVTFFENKLLGDILQRAQDHERIRSFIMNNSLALIFSTLTFAVFSIILLIYNSIIFFPFPPPVLVIIVDFDILYGRNGFHPIALVFGQKFKIFPIQFFLCYGGYQR